MLTSELAGDSATTPFGVGQRSDKGVITVRWWIRDRDVAHIEGFKLYDGVPKSRPGKWLDLVALRRSLLPKADIQAVRYLIVRVSARPGDPDQPVRQDLQAVATLPG